MRNRPAETHFHIRDLVIPPRKQFRIPERLAAVVPAQIGHERPVSAHHNPFDIGRRHGGAFPAVLEIGCPVDPVVERAGEVKVGADERFNHRAILVDVALEAGAHDHSFVIQWRCPNPFAFQIS